MLTSIIRSCATSNALDILRTAKDSGTKSRPAELQSLIDLVGSLRLSHFGSISQSRMVFSALPDSLFELEKWHPGRLNASSACSYFPPNKVSAIDDPIQEDGVTNQIANVATVYTDPKQRFVMQIFFLPKGCVMPLHDHPNMAVITKILRGSLDVTSYTCLDAQDAAAGADTPIFQKLLASSPHGKPIVPSGRTILNDDASGQSVALLLPETGNMHAMRALEHTLFFDILTPPYFPPARDCTYYKIIKVDPSTNTIVSTEAELSTVHSSYEDHSSHLFFAQPFQPTHFECYEVPWNGELLSL